MPKKRGTKVAEPAADRSKHPVSVLAQDPKNARAISDPALAGLSASTHEFGDLGGIVWNERSGLLVAGHQRMKTLVAAGATEWIRTGDTGWITHPVTGERFAIRIVDWDETKARAANLTANNQAIQGTFEIEHALAQIASLHSMPSFGPLMLGDMEAAIQALNGIVAPGGNEEAGTGAGSLAERFLVPPFSVLDARQGYWQERKRAWLSLGIKSELGRVAPIGGGADAAGSGEGRGGGGAR